MTLGRFSAELVAGWMDDLEGRPKWMALFADDPYGVVDPLTVEIIGGSYARQEGLWVRSDAKSLTLDAGVVWRSLVPGTVVAAVGAFDDPFNGTLLFRDMLELPREYPAGGTFTLSAGQYVLGMDL